MYNCICIFINIAIICDFVTVVYSMHTEENGILRTICLISKSFDEYHLQLLETYLHSQSRLRYTVN